METIQAWVMDSANPPPEKGQTEESGSTEKIEDVDGVDEEKHDADLQQDNQQVPEGEESNLVQVGDGYKLPCHTISHRKAR